MAILTLVARHDPRPSVADAAAKSLLQIIQTHGSEWQPNVWPCALTKGIAYLLDFPPPNANPDAPVVILQVLLALSHSIKQYGTVSEFSEACKLHRLCEM